MKIEVKKILQEGLVLHEDIAPKELDLQTDIIKFKGLIKADANIEKITNAVTVDLRLNGLISGVCSRCLDEFELIFKKDLKLSYPVEKLDTIIDLGPDIREEIILDYPVKPLCNPNCKGLCPKCGKKLAESVCSCRGKE